jgi:4'-phosphopantetheinyl transferase
MQTVLTDAFELVEHEFPEFPRRVVVPPLELNAVHSWFAPVSGNPAQLAEYRNLLSRDEVQSAERFRFERDRQTYIFAHGMLRILLGAYSLKYPAELRFEYSAHAKPSLAFPTKTGFEFNLSHTAGAVLVGVCRDRQIGADIELIREDFDLEEIAARFFTGPEQACLHGLPTADRARRFFEYWTRKEAILKARGDGLSFPLTLVDVSRADNSAILLSGPDIDGVRQWTILPVKVPVEYEAAVALRPCT